MSRDPDALADRVGLRAGGLGASGDPALENGDLLAVEPDLARRHLTFAYTLQEEAPRGLAGDDCRTGLAAESGESCQAKVEAPLLLLGSAVAVETVGAEYRPDVSLEDGCDAGGWGDRIGRPCRRADGSEHKEQDGDDLPFHDRPLGLRAICVRSASDPG